MTNALGIAATLFAFASGSILGCFAYEGILSCRRKDAMKASLGSSSLLDALSISLESSGMPRQIIMRAIRNSKTDHEAPHWVSVLFASNWQAYQTRIRQAGLDGFVTKNGVALTNLQLVIVGCAAGACVGAVFSSALMVIGLVCGYVWSVTALFRALKEEAQNRSFVAEKQLSQMIEVVILGLKSGMTFDRALGLFHSNFDGALSSSMALAQSQWMHGFVDRSDGLRAVAQSYDSPLFERLAENIIRSLRFGTSLAGNLSLLASEARAIRKAKLEEKVAKAPVKMLLPVGALILPAMLVLIMGPIMLDLMQGF